MDAAAVAMDVRAHFGPGRTVRQHHNHTGPNTLSFKVTSSTGGAWVKVAASSSEDERLRRWADLATTLTAHYSAPPVMDVIAIQGQVSLVFPFLGTPVASPHTVRSHPTPVLSMLDALHDDDSLATRLGPPVTAASSFDQLWLRRHRADIKIVEGYVPHAEHSTMVSWLDDLTRQMGHPAFRCHVHSPIHADPWHENMLLDDNEFWMLDWDGLRIGDPAIDTAIVMHDAFGPDVASWPWPHPSPDGDAAHRLGVYLQAIALDQVIDCAADWVQNDDPRIKAAKQRSYQGAMSAYATMLAHRPGHDVAH